MIEIYIGCNVHKRTLYVTVLDEDGSIREKYEIANAEGSWEEPRKRYLPMAPEMAMEVSTSWKYVARKLRDMGFSVHLADPVKLALIFNTAKKNDKVVSYKLAKFLRLKECTVFLNSGQIELIIRSQRFRHFTSFSYFYIHFHS